MENNTQNQSQVNDWSLYKRVLPYLKGLWRYFAVSVLGMLVVAATGPTFAYLIKPIINEGFVDKNIQQIHWIPAAIIGLFVLRGIANFINEYTTSFLSISMVQKIRRELFSKLHLLPVGYFSENSRGRILSRLLNDVGGITNAGFNVLTVIAKDGVSVLGLLGLLFYLDWRLTLIIFAALIIISFIVRTIGRKMRELSHKNQHIIGRMMQVISESVDGARVIRIYDGKGYEEERLAKEHQSLLHNVTKQAAAGAISSAATQLLIASALALIIYFASQQAAQSNFSAGDFISFLTAMLMMFDPVKRMTGVISSLQYGLAAAQSVFSFLDEKTEPDEGDKILSADTGDVVFDNVTFRYPMANTNAVNGLSLRVPQGSVLALVGESGCGKTSTVNLLPRFFDIKEGSIRIGDYDIRDYQLDSLRSQMALVSQDIVLFNDTIANNIAYGHRDIAPEKILEAARAANALNFIEQLPEGLETEIGEHGLKLSGGQRQRIAIARALLKDAPILILDEATSALDTESERLVQTALENLMRNRTTIVIAHRLSTIEMADNIVVMHEGRIAEQGRHAELLQKGGRYAILHAMQFNQAANV